MTEAQIDQDFQTFLQRATVIYRTRDGSIADALALIRETSEQRIEETGLSSVSVFEIVARQFVNTGDLVEVKEQQEPQMPEEIATFIKQYEKNEISTFQLRRRYSSDPAFRHWYDVATGLAKLAEPPQTITLTREQYSALPAAVVQRKYRQDPAFRAAVDALEAQRQIRVTEVVRG